MFEITSFEALHDEEEADLLLKAKLIYIDNVGVFEFSKDLGFVIKALDSLIIDLELCAEQFDRDVLLCIDVDTLVDETHSTFADLSEDLPLSSKSTTNKRIVGGAVDDRLTLWADNLIRITRKTATWTKATL